MKDYFTILFICLLVVAGSAQKEKNYECSNQENPLLDEDDLFTCGKIKECPTGFFCERRDEFDDTGFCCPDMEQLNKLYGNEENNEEPVSRLETNHQENSMEAATDNEATDADYILDPEYGTKFSCKKQKYELKCRNGTLKTQSTIRWYFDGEECDFYPWGYCPGDLVVESTTLLTKRACEELCIFDKNSSSELAKKEEFSTELRTANVDLHIGPLVDTPANASDSAATVPSYTLQDLVTSSLNPTSITTNNSDNTISNTTEKGQTTDDSVVHSENSLNLSEAAVSGNHASLENRDYEDGKQLVANSVQSTVSEDDLTKTITEKPIGQNLPKAYDYDLILFSTRPDSKLEPDDENREAKEKSKQLEKFERSKMRCVASPSEECTSINVNGMEPMSFTEDDQKGQMAQIGQKDKGQNRQKDQGQHAQKDQKDKDIIEHNPKNDQNITEEKTAENHPLTNIKMALGSVANKLGTSDNTRNETSEENQNKEESVETSLNKIPTITYVAPGGSVPDDPLHEGDYNMEETATEDEDYDSVVVDKKGIKIEEPAKEYQPLMCLRLPYRELCDNGLGAQYTVRWVVIDDLCQSIPFGYCNNEKNMLLPLTEADCRIRCLHESVDDVHFGSSQTSERYIDKQFLSRLHHHFINRLI